MEKPEEKHPQIDISKEMSTAYLQYSMSVIVGRALPDVRDGLKPVHRRILYAMNDLSNYHNKPYKKSARIVGDVIGKYHPHGDVAVYETMVRMAQDFSMRYLLVDGQGNFGSIDGDAAAAHRYTEVRMTEFAEEILRDIDKDTVSFKPNYDNSLQIPSVLPCKIPNLLANGSSGIAVGMATNIPPHNLGELIQGCLSLIENPELSVEELMTHVKGPDFPTSAIIVGRNGLLSAYKKGRGVITLRAVAEVNTEKNRDFIIITELPYQVNKARLIESMATLVKEKRVEGISDIRDESSREGLRIVVSVKRGEDPHILLNRLYKFTQMQVSFGIILLALDAQGQPKVFNLNSMLNAFIQHRKDVVTRRCIFELKKAEARAHLLEGLTKALGHIDEIVATIKASKEPVVAKQALIQKFSFSDVQAQAILEMRLQRLTGLERKKIEDELLGLKKKIEELKKILSDTHEIFKIIKEELNEMAQKFISPRKTKIEEAEAEEETDESLISREDMIVSISYEGQVKRIPLDEYRIQKRGGKGLKGVAIDEDFVWRIFSADTLTNLLVFSNRGKVYWSKVYKLPQGSRTAKGKSIKNIIHFESDESIREVLPVKEFSKDHYAVLLTEKGIIKKTSLDNFSRPRQNGVIALSIAEEDHLIAACLTDGVSDLFIFTEQGKAIRFAESNVRPMGRTARGVKGVSLEKEDKVVYMEAFSKESKDTIFLITKNGYGKRTSLDEYRTQSRGGKGMIAQKTTDKTGLVVSALRVSEKDQVMLTTNQGQSIRTEVSGISLIGRNTQGVRVMNLKSGEHVTGMAVIQSQEEMVDS